MLFPIWDCQYQTWWCLCIQQGDRLVLLFRLIRSNSVPNVEKQFVLNNVIISSLTNEVFWRLWEFVFCQSINKILHGLCELLSCHINFCTSRIEYNKLSKAFSLCNIPVICIFKTLILLFFRYSCSTNILEVSSRFLLWKKTSVTIDVFLWNAFRGLTPKHYVRDPPRCPFRQATYQLDRKKFQKTFSK